MESIKNAVVAAKSSLLIIDTLVKIKQVVMVSTPYANAAVIRKNEFGQKWIIHYKRLFLDKNNYFISSCFD